MIVWTAMEEPALLPTAGSQSLLMYLVDRKSIARDTDMDCLLFQKELRVATDGDLCHLWIPRVPDHQVDLLQRWRVATEGDPYHQWIQR